MKRVLAISLIVLVVLFIAGGIALRLFLHSTRMVGEVTSRLEKLYGGPVRVDKVDIGWAATTISGVAFYEDKSNPAQAQPWLRIAKLKADVSLGELAKGQLPSRVALSGVVATLRFDDNGALLTRVPVSTSGPLVLPDVIITEGAIISRRAGQPDLTINEITGQLTNQAPGIVLTGAANGPELGKFILKASLDKSAQCAAFDLRSDGILHFTQSVLDRLPLLPANTWEEIQIRDGDSGFALTGNYDLSKKVLHYHAVLSPENMHVMLPALALEAGPARAQLTIEDNLFQLRHAEGQMLDGKFRMDADLDLRKPIATLTVARLDVENMEPGKMPDAWHIPAAIRKVAAGGGKLFASATGKIAIFPANFKLFSAVTVASLTSALPGVRASLLSALHEPEIQGQATGQIRVFANSREPIEFDAKLGDHNTLQGRLRMRNVSFAEIAKSLDLQPPVPVEGKIGLTLAASLPLGRKEELLKSFKADGSVETKGIIVAGTPVENAIIDVVYNDGTLTFKTPEIHFAANKGGQNEKSGSVAVSGQARIEPPGPALADVRIDDLSVGLFRDEAQDKFVGTFSAHFGLAASTQTLRSIKDIEANGTIISDRLQVGSLILKKISTSVQFAKGIVMLPDIKVQLDNCAVSAAGQISLSDQWPFQGTVTGRDWDLRRVAKLLGSQQLSAIALNGALSTNIAVQGKLHPLTLTASAEADLADVQVDLFKAGHVRLRGTGVLPASPNFDMARGTFRIDVKVPDLQAHHIPVEEVNGSLQYEKGAFDYKVGGASLGGAFNLEGEIPWESHPEAAAKKGRLSIRGVQLARLSRALHLENVAAVTGQLNLEAQFTHDALDRFPEGHGLLKINNPRWNDRPLAVSLQSEISLSEQEARLTDLTGDLAQGTIEAQLTYFFREPERSWFAINLNNVETSELLLPAMKAKVEGPLQARVRGNLGATWRGHADLELTRGKVLGLQVADWRVPILWNFAPGEMRGQIDIFETAAQLARGRAAGKISLTWDRGARVDGDLRLDGVDLANFLNQTVGPSQLGGGQANVRVNFSGRDVRSPDDLTANVSASFSQAQPLQLPVLNQIAPFLGVGPSTTFQNGALQGRLDRGVLRVQQFTLQGTTLQVFADGSVSLKGQLNLGVIAKTGEVGLSGIPLGPISVRIPITGPVPVTLLVEASTLLANHTAYLQVTGTARSPIIQPRPLPILSGEAIRFFLSQSKLPISANP